MKKGLGMALVVVGAVGLVVALPVAFFVWNMSGFLNPGEGWMIIVFCFGFPLLAIILITAGAILLREAPIQPTEPTPGSDT